jgi:heme-degrading monooxygenase HmoA
MYGRLVEMEGVDPSKREAAEQNVRENVLPALKGMDGFAGFVVMYDEQNRRIRGVALWETRESAEAAERQLKPKREEFAQRMGFTIRSADAYEVLVAELPVGASV